MNLLCSINLLNRVRICNRYLLLLYVLLLLKLTPPEPRGPPVLPGPAPVHAAVRATNAAGGGWSALSTAANHPAASALPQDLRERGACGAIRPISNTLSQRTQREALTAGTP